MSASDAAGYYRAFPQRQLREPRFRALSAEARWLYLALRVDAPNLAGIFAWSTEATAALTGLSRARLARALGELRRGRPPWLYLDDGLVWLPGALADDPFVSLKNPKHREHVERVLASLPHGAPLVRRFRENCDALIAKAEADAKRVSGEGIGRGSADSRRGMRKGNADTKEVEVEVAVAVAGREKETGAGAVRQGSLSSRDSSNRNGPQPTRVGEISDETLERMRRKYGGDQEPKA